MPLVPGECGTCGYPNLRKDGHADWCHKVTPPTLPQEALNTDPVDDPTPRRPALLVEEPTGWRLYPPVTLEEWRAQRAAG